MALSQPEFQRLVQVIQRLPGFANGASERRRWFDLAFAGEPTAATILGTTNLDGMPLLVASELVRRLSDYGRVSDGRPALVVLAEAIQAHAGEEDRRFLAAFIARSAAAPTTANPLARPATPIAPLTPLPLANADQAALVNILARVASEVPGLTPQGFFRDLMSRAELPPAWRQQLAGIWTGAARADARSLITWAQGQGTNPAQPSCATLGSILLPLLDDLGLEDRRTVLDLIHRHHLCNDPTLLAGRH